MQTLRPLDQPELAMSVEAHRVYQALASRRHPDLCKADRSYGRLSTTMSYSQYALCKRVNVLDLPGQCRSCETGART